MNLTTIPEPENLKQWMQDLRQNIFKGDDDKLNWDSSTVWAANRLPKYFWDQWKPELKDRGFRWQSFSKLLRYRTDKLILWYRNELPWEDLVREITELMDSSIGRDLAKK